MYTYTYMQTHKDTHMDAHQESRRHKVLRCTLTTADKCMNTHTHKREHSYLQRPQDMHTRQDAWWSRLGNPPCCNVNHSGPFPTEARMAAWSLVRGPPASFSQMRHHLSSSESHQLSSLPSSLTSHLGHRRPQPLAGSCLWPAFVESPLPGRTVRTNGALSGSA